jgi:hypothetical protein
MTFAELNDPASGFVDVSPKLHEYLQQQGHDADFTPLFYNPQSKLYANFEGRGRFVLQDQPHVSQIDNSPFYNNWIETFSAAMKGFTGFFIASGVGAVAEALPAVVATESTTEAANVGLEDLVTEEAINADVLGEAADIQTATGEFLDPWDLQPDPTIMEKVALDPAATPTDWGAIFRGGTNIARLVVGANRDVQVAKARAGATQSGQSPGILPNYASFPSLGALRAGSGTTSGSIAGSGSSNLTLYVLGGIAILFFFVLSRR